MVIWGGWVDGAVSICYHLVTGQRKGLHTGAIMEGTGCTWNRQRAERFKQVSKVALLGKAPVADLRDLQQEILARHACDLDPYLVATDAMGTGLKVDVERLASQLHAHSKRLPCF